jgi:hypothetical protein
MEKEGPPAAHEHDRDDEPEPGGDMDRSGYEGAGVEEGGGYQRTTEESGGYEESGKEGDYDPRREGEEP